MYQVVVSPAMQGRTVKRILQTELRMSVRLLREIMRENGVTVDGQSVRMNESACVGSLIQVKLPKEIPTVAAEPIPLEICYEDDEVLVVNKPPGLLTHPSARERFGSLLAGVQAHLSRDGMVPHCVHRLDRDTSGLVMFAKHAHAHHLFDITLRRGLMHRTYCALARLPEDGEEVREIHDGGWLTIDLAIDLDPVAYSKRVIAESGQAAVTHVRRLAITQSAQMLQLVLETGRTHQIRVHLAAIGWSLLGDTHYTQPHGSNDARVTGGLRRQALHATRLSWIHPITKQLHEVSAPVPNDMRRAWRSLGGENRDWERLSADREDLLMIPAFRDVVKNANIDDDELE